MQAQKHGARSHCPSRISPVVGSVAVIVSRHEEMIYHRAYAIAGKYGEDDAQRIVAAQIELHRKGGGGYEKKQRHEKSRGEKTLTVLHDVTAGDADVFISDVECIYICVRTRWGGRTPPYAGMAECVHARLSEARLCHMVTLA